MCAVLTLRAPLAHSPILRSSIVTPTAKAVSDVSGSTTIDPDSLVEISDSNQTRAMSKARVYTDVNVIRPKDYWDYESLIVQWG